MPSPLSQLLTLERIEEMVFRGQSMDLGSAQVFGGQVLGQALLAAQATAPQRTIHSLHGYFLQRGDFTSPIDYRVEASRDGRSFSSRRVTASQRQQLIFTLAASFHNDEDGVQYQPRYDLPPPPETTPDLPATAVRARKEPGPTDGFELRLVPQQHRSEPQSVQWWLRVRTAITDEQPLQRAALAYISDIGLGTAAMLSCGYDPGNLSTLPPLTVASLDHALWFHRPVNINDWLLYSCTPRINQGGRGLGSGTIYDRQGNLIATTLQELLLRQPASPGD